MDYVSQNYWDNSYQSINFSVLPQNDPIRIWLKNYTPKRKGTCLEIGCFPGGILSFFGDLGYELNGIDLTPRVENDLPNWLQSKGYRVGNFTRADFTTYDFGTTQHDIVASFGFIEHFSDWHEILIKQAALVKKGGLFIVVTPNFRGIVQRMLHIWLDKKNYARHNTESMRPDQWDTIVVRNGFEVIFCGHFGNFMFWVDDEQRNWLQKLIINLIQSSTKRFLKYLPNSPAYSPFCGLIGRKL